MVSIAGFALNSKAPKRYEVGVSAAVDINVKHRNVRHDVGNCFIVAVPAATFDPVAAWANNLRFGKTITNWRGNSVCLIKRKRAAARS